MRVVCVPGAGDAAQWTGPTLICDLKRLSEKAVLPWYSQAVRLTLITSTSNSVKDVIASIGARRDMW